MSGNERPPEIIVFAGPKGSGKSTMTRMVETQGTYVNEDDIKKTISCSDSQAEEISQNLIKSLISKSKDFTFETSLSSKKPFKLLEKAKKNGYFIRCIYILTSNCNINIARINIDESMAGKAPSKDVMEAEYERSINMIPEMIEICDIVHIYDNTSLPFRIFKKRKDEYFHWENRYWKYFDIEQLTGIDEYAK